MNLTDASKALLDRCLVDINEGAWEVAEKTLKELLFEAPLEGTLNLLMAHVLMQLGRPSQASRFLRLAVLTPVQRTPMVYDLLLELSGLYGDDPWFAATLLGTAQIEDDPVLKSLIVDATGRTRADGLSVRMLDLIGKVGEWGISAPNSRRATALPPQLPEIARCLAELGGIDETTDFSRVFNLSRGIYGALQDQAIRDPSLLKGGVVGLETASSEPPFGYETIVLLRTAGRTGSLFFQSLFDAHPQVSTMMAWHYRQLFDAPNWRLSKSEIERVLFGLVMSEQVLENHLPRYLSWPLVLCQRAAASYMESGNRSNLHLLLALHRAYDRETYPSRPDAKVLFYHYHVPAAHDIVQMLAAVPSRRIKNLLFVREPVSALASHIKLIQDNWRTTTPWSMLYQEALHFPVSALLENSTGFINEMTESIAIRREDLSEQPERTLAAACAFVGIDLEPGLFSSTISGQPFMMGGQSGAADHFRFRPQAPASYGVFSEDDERFFNVLLYPMRQRYGYCEQLPASELAQEILWARDKLHAVLDLEKPLLARMALHCHPHDIALARASFVAMAENYLGILAERSTYPAMPRRLDV